MSKAILIKNGRVVDPGNKIDASLDVLIERGRIARVGKDIKGDGAQVIDASDKLILPGLVDMHVHLREPGREDKETVKTATAAALKGGVTSLLAMPNTSPAMDSPGNIKLLAKIISKDALVNVFICGAISVERKGQKIADIAKLKEAGAVAISDDGSSVDDAKIMFEAIKSAKQSGQMVICHCEDKTLSGKGVVNRGLIATRLGLRGISSESEYQRVERDILLAERAKAPVHITHISCKESVEAIRKAKKRGVKVSADVTPHHLALCEEAVLDYDTNFKMNPPLRSSADRQALLNGLKDGTIDAIASDHAPHTENEKDIEFDRAEFGVIGLETMLAVGISELVGKGILDFPDLIRKLSLAPAQILGLNKGTLSAGADADIIIVDPEKEWEVRKEVLLSKSKNCAFLGRKLKGVVEYAFCQGKPAYKAVAKTL